VSTVGRHGRNASGVAIGAKGKSEVQRAQPKTIHLRSREGREEMNREGHRGGTLPLSPFATVVAINPAAAIPDFQSAACPHLHPLAPNHGQQPDHTQADECHAGGFGNNLGEVVPYPVTNIV